jgi:hypothetical protein
VVPEAVARYNHLTNEGPSYFMWQILDEGREHSFGLLDFKIPDLHCD